MKSDLSLEFSNRGAAIGHVTKHTRLRVAGVLLLCSPLVFADFQAAQDAIAQGDYATAYRELLPVAEQGNGQAQYNIGVAYFEGKGVRQDYAEAAKWFRLAAEQGYAHAQNSLGVMYAQGLGVHTNLIEAYAWCGVSSAGGYSRGTACYQTIEQQLSPEERMEARRLTIEFRQKYLGTRRAEKPGG
jgi:hypothetical protein